MNTKSILIVTLLFTCIVHFMSPDWTLTDMSRRGDWIIIMFCIIDYLLLIRNVDKIKQRIINLCGVLGLIFIATCSVSGEEDEATFSLRIFEIFRMDNEIWNPMKVWIEGTNLASIIIFLLIQVFLVFRHFFDRRITPSKN